MGRLLRCWKENGEPHKYGYYESTWMSVNAAMNEVGVVLVPK